MGLYIKEMRIPENCARCDYIGLNVAIGCPVMSGTDGRATDCPLVDLGKHGDLIDADELKKEFPKDTDWEYPVNTNQYVCETIDNAKTVIEAEDGS